ncbi:4-hydroxybenzoate polyprenyltransferase [Lutibacter oricola]|uniref:4-hydroxybenzoate polyprenyltransferase n=1 Tax=Lutibacter oricola TaxID=762486 RepID=A0A1H2XL87_9FLAO|nr:geranylgeranylglycerol-phosphate geranylgeranyltransferase [Lutibacter oricola]SDW93587.1 4-hydroxybenzoate polyprenyltransferase [Lutibacter oricola]
MSVAVFFNLIRYKNLLLLIYFQLLIKYLLFPAFNIVEVFSSIQFIIFLLALVCITAAGNIINDIFDVEIDKVNKPNTYIVSRLISKEKAKRLYLFVNSIGVISGIYLSLNIQKPQYSFIFITVSLLLYYYSKKIKGTLLLGNIIVSFLIALSVYLLAIFNISNKTLIENSLYVKIILLLYTIFAFFINFSREIIKDIQDIIGDYKLKLNTLPISIGIKRSKSIIAISCFIVLSLLLFLTLTFAEYYKYTFLYLLLFSFLPLFYISIQILKSTTNKDFKKISLLLKIIMLFGVSSIILLSFKL